MDRETLHERMDRIKQIAGSAINEAMGLARDNAFGFEFVNDFYVTRHEITRDFKSMAQWSKRNEFYSGYREGGFKRFTITKARYRVLKPMLDLVFLLPGRSTTTVEDFGDSDAKYAKPENS